MQGWPGAAGATVSLTAVSEPTPLVLLEASISVTEAVTTPSGKPDRSTVWVIDPFGRLPERAAEPAPPLDVTEPEIVVPTSPLTVICTAVLLAAFT